MKLSSQDWFLGDYRKSQKDEKQNENKNGKVFISRMNFSPNEYLNFL